MVMFHSYIKLPEGNHGHHGMPCLNPAIFDNLISQMYGYCRMLRSDDRAAVEYDWIVLPSGSHHADGQRTGECFWQLHDDPHAGWEHSQCCVEIRYIMV